VGDRGLLSSRKPIVRCYRARPHGASVERRATASALGGSQRSEIVSLGCIGTEVLSRTCGASRVRDSTPELQPCANVQQGYDSPTMTMGFLDAVAADDLENGTGAHRTRSVLLTGKKESDDEPHGWFCLS
jgi:hypothetical protein